MSVTTGNYIHSNFMATPQRAQRSHTPSSLNATTDLEKTIFVWSTWSRDNPILIATSAGKFLAQIQSQYRYFPILAPFLQLVQAALILMFLLQFFTPFIVHPYLNFLLIIATGGLLRVIALATVTINERTKE